MPLFKGGGVDLNLKGNNYYYGNAFNPLKQVGLLLCGEKRRGGWPCM